MKKYLIFSLFICVNLYSQEISITAEFKKCRKEFSKKTCLSDLDNDSLAYYLDKCPAEYGLVENFGCPWPDTDGDSIPDKDDGCPNVNGETENFGCPWPDTDGDGILDKDDACLTLPGFPEENGCPKKGDCVEYFKNEKINLNNFKEEQYQNKSKFEALRKIIFSNIPKKNLEGNSIYVSIYVDTFINDNITFRCSSRSTLYHDKKLFLDQLFWTKDTFECMSRKFDKNIIPTFGMRASQTIDRNFINEMQKDGYYGFMKDFPEMEGRNSQKTLYYPKNNTKYISAISATRLMVNFGQYMSKDEVTVEIFKSRDFNTYTYGYINNQWQLIKNETMQY